MRLQTINARVLIRLLARARRLGYKDTNSSEYNAVDCLVQEANEDILGANSTSALPGARIGQGRDSTASLHPSPVEASRGPKRRKTDDHDPLGIDSLPRAKAHPTRLAPAPHEKKCTSNVKLRGKMLECENKRSYLPWLNRLVHLTRGARFSSSVGGVPSTWKHIFAVATS